MVDLRLGDVVYSHFDKHIQARGIVVEEARPSKQPENLAQLGATKWLPDGWLVRVDFETSLNKIQILEHIDVVRPLLLEEFPSPINSRNYAAQKTYLTQISSQLATYFDSLLIFDGLHDWALDQLLMERAAEVDEQILLDESLSETDRSQVILARIGQGKFRQRVLNFERKCRVTGMAVNELLIASHIKPWRDSNNEERISGANGLMLSPHVDRLFDRGLMTFDNSGRVIFSKKVKDEVRDRWLLTSDTNVGIFSSLQKSFLEYHRDLVFKG